MLLKTFMRVNTHVDKLSHLKTRIFYTRMRKYACLVDDALDGFYRSRVFTSGNTRDTFFNLNAKKNKLMHLNETRISARKYASLVKAA